MSARCIGEPISWLRLERLHLREIEGAERSAIEAHLAACPACAACLERIVEDDERALPPLLLHRATPVVGLFTRLTRRAPFVIGGLAAAALIVLLVRRRGSWDDGERASAGASRWKGGDVAFSLVREDGERVAGAEGIYRDGDRWKAVVTCPPGGAASFDLVVYDPGGPSFPLPAAPGLACGNEVPIPGAFRLTGSAEETVCVVWSANGAVDRAALAIPSDGRLTHASCKTLRHAEAGP